MPSEPPPRLEPEERALWELARKESEGGWTPAAHVEYLTATRPAATAALLTALSAAREENDLLREELADYRLPLIFDGKDMAECFADVVKFLRDSVEKCRAAGYPDDCGSPTVVWENIGDEVDLALLYCQQLKRELDAKDAEIATCYGLLSRKVEELGAEIERLKRGDWTEAEFGRLSLCSSHPFPIPTDPLTWSKEPPTEPGYYGVKGGLLEKPIITHVVMRDTPPVPWSKDVSYLHGRPFLSFCGPIPLPEEPNE